MTELFNTFEGGTDGTTITTSNSGGDSGTAFTFVNAVGTRRFNAANARHGSMGVELDAPAGEVPYLMWRSTAWPGSTTAWVRMYFKLTDVTGTNFTIMQFRRADGTAIGTDVRVTTASKITLRPNISTQYTSSTTLSTNTWYRLEIQLDSNSSTGHIQARLFYGANLEGATPDESFGSATDNWNTGDGTVGGWSFGLVSNPGTNTMFMDSVGISDVGWIGSADPATPLDTPVVTVTAQTGPTTIGGSDGEITVTWPAVTNAGGYDAGITTGLNQTTGFTIDSTSATSPYTFDGLVSGDYTVAVRAKP
jgi:hypothetical protein